MTNADDEPLPLTLDAIAGDDVVNIAEKAAGFVIRGTTGLGGRGDGERRHRLAAGAERDLGRRRR